MFDHDNEGKQQLSPHAAMARAAVERERNEASLRPRPGETAEDVLERVVRSLRSSPIGGQESDTTTS